MRKYKMKPVLTLELRARGGADTLTVPFRSARLAASFTKGEVYA